LVIRLRYWPGLRNESLVATDQAEPS
jgi:hypothetical protein